MCILVVDDEPSICTLVRRVLQRAGYDVQEAYSGQQALDMVAHTRPALVLVDRMMPGMTGDELVSCLRVGPSPLPCILMSAHTTDPQIAEIPFLAKPFAIEALVDLVGRTLTWHEQRNQLPAA